MSTWIDTAGTCPACNATTAARVATSVHVSRVPEVRADVLDRTINRFTCRGCERVIEIDHAFTYVDVERGHWVQVEPSRRRSEWAAAERAAMSSLDRGLDLTSPIVSELAVSAHRRVVFGSEELREKLIVWNAGIEDGLIECIKVRTLIDDPTLSLARLIVDRVTDEGGLELVRVEDGQPPRTYAVPATWVDRALDESASLRARFPELFRGGFVNALRLLALVLLAAFGCSQPSPREPRPPGPNDAAASADAAVEDTATLEGTAMVDAAAPRDAARTKVAWELLRGAERSAGAFRVAALVVRTESEGGGTIAVFDRGQEDGVRKGWKGRVLDRNDKRVFDVFVVFKVEGRRCFARTQANPDQLARNNRAVLWDSNVDGEP